MNGKVEYAMIVRVNEKKLLYISSSLPALTLTFIYREIFALRERGFDIATVSMNRPSDQNISEEAHDLLSTSFFLDEVPFLHKCISVVRVLFTQPRRFVNCVGLFLRAQPMQSFRDYLRLGYHLCEACYLYVMFRDSDTAHIHSHFVNGPSSLAMFLSKLLGIPFSFTMHASNIWLDPIALKNKLQECEFCVSISEYNKKYVVATYGDQYREKIHIVHCGINSANLRIDEKKEPNSNAVRILAVGQLTERKGFHVLIQACGVLKGRGISFRCTIVGEGTQRETLKELIKHLNLSECIHMVGAKPQEELPEFFGDADVFALPCVITDDGWRDGIPVALMEAMLWRLPVVSTNILGLPELIDSGKNGLLVEPNDPVALANAIADLANSNETRERLGSEAIKKVLTEFNSERSVDQLEKLFCS